MGAYGLRCFRECVVRVPRVRLEDSLRTARYRHHLPQIVGILGTADSHFTPSTKLKRHAEKITAQQFRDSWEKRPRYYTPYLCNFLGRREYANREE